MYLIGKRGEESFLCAEDAQRGSGLASVEMTEKGLGLDPGGLLLIGGRKFAELGDGGGDHVQSEINIGGGGVAAVTEAQVGRHVSGRLCECCDQRHLDEVHGGVTAD